MPMLDYQDSLGNRFTGHLAIPDKPRGAAVLIAHGAPGLSVHERTVADRLAALGYMALAADYHGGGGELAPEETGARMALLQAGPSHLRAALAGALAALVSQPGVDHARIAAIGYCFGGYGVLELACTGADLAAVVAFHSILPLARGEDAAAIRGKVLVLNGTRDPYAPVEARAAFEAQMNNSGVDWQMHLYGQAEHAFAMAHAARFGREGIAYHAGTDRRSWQAMLTLFGETIDRG